MASDRWVVLDDQDTAISYTGNWSPDIGSKENIPVFGPPYLHTLQGTSADGIVTLDFNGTAIRAWGTNIVANASTNPDPNIECFIDDTSIGRLPPNPWDQNNQRLCEKFGLQDGPHRFRIGVKVQSPKQTFWLDRVEYVPSPSVPLDNKTILFDNRDIAIRFDPSWKALGAIANVTTQTNSTMQVDFVGVSISWIAFIPKELSHAGTSGTFAIDNGEPKPFPLRGLPPDATSSVYNQEIFTTAPDVEAGQHTLTVTFLGTNRTTPLCLTHLFIKNGTFPTLDSSNNTTGTPQPQPNPGRPIGAILGGVLGGLALLIILAGVFLWRRRTRWKHKSIAAQDTNSPPFEDHGHKHPVLDSEMMVQTSDRRGKQGKLRGEGRPAHRPNISDSLPIYQ